MSFWKLRSFDCFNFKEYTAFVFLTHNIYILQGKWTKSVFYQATNLNIYCLLVINSDAIWLLQITILKFINQSSFIFWFCLRQCKYKD